MPPAYPYCPFCRTPLADSWIHGAQRRRCPACGFIHFRDPKVAVVAVMSDGAQVLLIRRGVEPRKGEWALPGGFMDAGELPESALARELMEEVGLRPAIGELLAIFPLHSGDEVAGIVLAYAAHSSGPHLLPIAGDDVTDARWFAPDALPEPLAFESTRTLLAAWARTLDAAPAHSSANRSAPEVESTKESSA